MANGYYDFGDFYGITPYVGAGIGASYNTISHFRDINIITGGGGYADDNSEWNFAWALARRPRLPGHRAMTIDFGYSFISLGDASTGSSTTTTASLSRRAETKASSSTTSTRTTSSSACATR